jgi:hypothetical protein
MEIGRSKASPSIFEDRTPDRRSKNEWRPLWPV